MVTESQTKKVSMHIFYTLNNEELCFIRLTKLNKIKGTSTVHYYHESEIKVQWGTWERRHAGLSVQ